MGRFDGMSTAPLQQKDLGNYSKREAKVFPSLDLYLVTMGPKATQILTTKQIEPKYRLHYNFSAKQLAPSFVD